MNKTRKNLQKIQSELNHAYKHIEIALGELSEVNYPPPKGSGLLLNGSPDSRFRNGYYDI